MSRNETAGPRRRWSRPLRALLAASLAIPLVVLAAPPDTADAAIVRGFSVRFTTNTTGQIELIGNTVISCWGPGRATASLPADPACAATQQNQVPNTVPPNTTAATKFTNNEFEMHYVDADADPTTFNSSAANLTLGAGATVLWAGLYWAADPSKGTSSNPAYGPAPQAAPNSALRNQIRFRSPASGGYVTLTAAQLDLDGGSNAFNAFVDVTSLVQAGGAGTYTAANVQSGTGENRAAGWSLVYVTRDGSQPARNLTVFDGYVSVRNATGENRINVPVSGFQTPPAGTVRSRVGITALEGDRTSTGDQLLLNNVALGTGIRPANDFFNSTISDFGVYTTGSNPTYFNTLGLDVVRVDTSGILPNSATSATVTLATGGETYYVNSLTFSTELYSPRLDASKTVVDLNGGVVQPGDLLEYTLVTQNNGFDASTASVVEDPIPPNATYVPGTISIDGGARTDAAGDDTAEFAASTNVIRARIGTGATATNGGRMAVGQSTTIKFRVRVNLGLPDGTNVDNVANLSYIGAQTLTALTGQSNLARVTVSNPLADLSVSKTPVTPFVAGAQGSYTISLTNAGPQNASTPVTLTDTLPKGMTFVSATGTSWSCAAAAPDAQGRTPVTCTLAAPLTVTTAPPVTLTVALSAASTATSLTNTVTASSGTPDPSTANNTAVVPTAISRAADLSVTKRDNGAFTAGSSGSYTITVVSSGPTTLLGGEVVRVNDELPAGLTLGTATTSPWVCTGPTSVSCTYTVPASSTIVSGQTLSPLTLPVNVTAATTGSVVNTAGVSGPATAADPNPANDTSTVTTPVRTVTDVALTKTATGGFVAGSATASTFVVTARNNGPSALPAGETVQVVDTLPASVVLVATPPGCTVVSQTLTCATPLAGPVPPGASLPPITIAVTVLNGAQTVVNTATATVLGTAGATDPVTSNNTATVSATATARADLGITKTHSPVSLTAGSSGTYTLTVTNGGPSIVPAGATVVDALPAGLVLTGASGASCSPTSGAGPLTVTCTLRELASGTQQTIVLAVSVPSTVTPQTVVNSATVASPVPEPDDASRPNTAADPTPIVTSADLSVLKRAVGTFTAGGTATYTLEVGNTGPSAAADVSLVDNLPAGVTLTRLVVADAAFSCTTAPTSLTCTGASLPVTTGATPTVTFEVRVDPSTPAGGLVNAVSVSSATADPNAADNTSTVTTPVATAADLSLTKVVRPGDPSTITPGRQVTYRLGVANAGPSVAARPLTIVDTLPLGASYAGVGTPAWSCTASGQRVTCTYDAAVAPGGAAPDLDLVVLVDPAVVGSLTNSATASSPTPDATPATASITSPVQATVNLALTKQALNPPFVAGATGTFRLGVTNLGPSVAAAPFTVVDTLPSGLTYAPTAIPGWVCGAAGQVVTCSSQDPVPVGGITPNLDLAVTVAASVPASLVNDAVANPPAGATDNDPVDNTASVVVPIVKQADLSVTKALTGALVAGSTAAYTLTVGNAGPSDVPAGTPVTVTDTLPVGLSLLAPPAGWTCSGAPTITCTRTLGLAVGASTTVSVAVAVDPLAAPGPVDNLATVASPLTDPVPGNNGTSLTSPLTASADLTVGKTLASSRLRAGEPATYVVTVANAGPSTARGPLTLRDTLPPGLTFVTASGSGWACSATGQEVTCSSGGNLPAGSSSTVRLVVQPAADLPPGSVTNVVEVSSSTPDPTPATASLVSPLAREADLVLVKDRDGAFVAGTEGVYSFVVRNDGPGTAEGPIAFTDTLPAGLSFASFTGLGWGCTPAGAVVTCARITTAEALEPAAAFPPVRVRAAISAAATGTVTNSATVTSGTTDAATATNTGSDTGPIEVETDLSLAKELESIPLVNNVPATYVVTLKNLGPSVLATGSVVQVVDDLPSPQVFGGAAAPWTCASTNTTRVTCSLTTTASFAAGATLPTLRIGVPGTVVPTGARNVASLVPLATDPNPGNDSDFVDVKATDRADLSVTKVSTPSPLVAGSTATYTLAVRNAGPSTATSVQLVDDLPVGVTVVSTAVSGPAGVLTACGETVGILTCTGPGVLPAGATATLTIVVRLSPSLAPGSLRNAAVVSSAVGDPNTGDNTGVDLAGVVARADLTTTKVLVGQFVAGRDAVYRISVRNDGPSDAQDVRVADALPAGLTVVAVSPSSGLTCTNDLVSVACSATGALAPGTTETVDLTVRLRSGLTGEVINEATARGSTPDPNPGGNTGAATATVRREADLTLTKAAVGAVTAGATATFRLDVRNLGDSAASSITVTDDLPGGLTYTGLDPATDPAWSCAAAGQTVTCTIAGPVAPNGELPALLLRAFVGAGVTGSLTNTASVEAEGNEDPNEGNNDGSATFTVATSADLSLTKAAAGPLVPGSTGTYRFTATNAGPSAADAVRVTDTLPASVSFVGASTPGWSCAAVGQVVTCTLAAALAPLGSTVVDVDVAIEPGLTGPMTNTATVSSLTPDPVPADNKGTTTDALTPRADLVATKKASAPGVAGRTATFTLGVRNLGPSVAAGPISITDDVPAGLVFQQAIGGGWTCAPIGSPLTCLRNEPLAPGEAAPDVVLTVLVDPALPSTLTSIDNTMAVSTPTLDPVGANDTSTATLDTSVEADLAVTKVHDSAVFVAGETGTYRIVVANTGPSALPVGTPLTLTDLLPDGQTVSPDAVTSPWSCTNVSTPTPTSVDCTTTLAAPLAKGDTIALDLLVDIAAGTTPGSIANRVVLQPVPGYPDPNDANNGDSDNAEVVGRADLALVKSATASSLTAGSTGTFLLDARNLGPSVAASLTITDVLPDGLTYTGGASRPGGWTCAGTTTVTCTNPATLAPNATLTLTLPVSVAADVAPQTVENRATLVSDTPDADPTNNTRTLPIEVVTEADLGVTKTAVSTPWTAGETGTFTITVTNLGPSDAAGQVSIVDSLPPGLRLRSASDPSCTASAQTVTCTLAGGLTVGASKNLTFIVDVDPGAAGALTNRVAVAGPTADPNDANDEAAATATVVGRTDLSLQKASFGTFTPGRAGVYSLTVTNGGPSVATSVTVRDPLPAGLVPTSAVGGGWSCVLSGTDVTCTTGGPVAPGAAAPPITLTVAISAASTGTVTNVATATSPTAPATATANLTTPLSPEADLVLVKKAAGPALAGGLATFTLTPSNEGPSDAAGPLTVTDVLPAGLTFTGDLVSDGWTCASTGATTVTCTRPDGLAAGTVGTAITIQASVPPTLGVTTVTNTASLASPTTDTRPGNNTDVTAALDVTVQADLAIAKTHQPAVLEQGGTGTYVITVANLGPSAIAAGQVIQVVDPLPTGITYEGGDVAPWDCIGTTTVTCALGLTATLDVTSGVTATGPGTVRLDLPVAISTDTPLGTITNTATVIGPLGYPDPVSANNSATDAATAIDRADLSIRKRSPATFTAGATGVYTLLVGNGGPSIARGPITLTDTLPNGLTYVSFTSDPDREWTCSGAATVSCTRAADLPSSTDSDAISIVVLLAPSLPATTLVNNVVGASPSPDPNPGNNTGKAQTLVVQQADLRLAKTAVSSPFVAGTDGTFTVEVGNAGPSDSAGPLAVTDSLPPGLTFTGPTDVGDGWTCDGVVDVSCERPLGLAAGSSTSFTLTVAVGAGEAGSTKVNTATVSGPTVDPDSTNNSGSSLPTPVVGRADLSLTKVVDTSPVVAGLPVTFVLTAANAGPSVSEGVVVTDTLQAGLRFVARSSDPRCTSQDNVVVSCALGALPLGSTASVRLVATVPSTATVSIDNTASVTATTVDPDTSNNEASATAVIGTSADLTLAKLAPAVPLAPGVVGTYQLVVSNRGPSQAVAPSVNDDLPVGLTFSATGSSAGCSATGQLVTCTLGDLDMRASSTVLVAVKVVDGTTAVTNTATVGSTTDDPNTGDNEAGATWSPAPPIPPSPSASADLGVTKVAVGSFTPGATATWHLAVGNAGPDAAPGVRVLDTLPPGATFAGATGTGWTCAAAGTLVTCLLADALSVGSTATVDVRAVLAADAVGSVTNRARVSGAVFDPNAANDEASVTTTLGAITLAAQSLCLRNTPYVDYVVTPQGFTPARPVATLTWSKPNGTVVSTLKDQPLRGRLLWPGTVLGPNGAPVDWPGWQLVNGVWVPEQDGLRPNLVLTAQVNPTASATVTYPAASATCQPEPPTGSLPGTGTNTDDTVPVGLAVLALGLALVGATARPRRRRA